MKRIIVLCSAVLRVLFKIVFLEFGDMEACSSREDLIVKMRKPYTITKQRERWTDDEHKRFLEALKIYGRAWQRIEEHIGTKTAVQIRSHAQKFFSKLEKEASNSGVPFSHALDIAIPPPRPKRKPTNPYPRKDSKASICTLRKSTPACLNNEQLHSGGDSTSEKAAGNEKLERTKKTAENGSHLEILSLLPDTVCRSISCMSKFSGDEHISQKRVLVPKGTVTNAESKNSPINVGDIERWQSCAECSDDVGDGKLCCLCLKLQRQTALPGIPVAGTEEVPESLQSKLQCCDDPPNVVAMNSVDESKQNQGQSTGCDSRIATSISQKTGDCTSLNAFSDPSTLTESQQFINTSSTQQLPRFHPFAPFHDKLNAPGSFFHMSSAFSNLLVSTLLQNPAVHAAACFAASFLPSIDQGSSLNPTSDTSVGGIPSRNLYTPPSVAAIAAATVAAATAWWAAHGIFSTYHLPFTSGLAFSSGTATRDSRQQGKENSENNARNEKDGHVLVKKDQQMLKPGCSPEVLTPELSTSKMSPLSSLDSNDHGRVENPRDIEQKDFDEAGELLPSARIGDHDSNQNSKGNNKKHDRSSCGSNSASSSEENDALLEKLDEGEKLEQEIQVAQTPASETAYRRCRNGGSVNEQWKEVSEEGRMAFQALFSREVLPQSFSPPQAEDAAVKLNKQEKGNSTLLVDLNRKYSECDCVIVVDEAPSSGSKSLFVSKNVQGKSKTRRTGFKPYKRCSVEAVEDRSGTIEEKSNKRIRTEGPTTTIS